MPRRPRRSDAALEQGLAEVQAHKDDPTSAQAQERLGRALGHASSFVVEAAAKLIAENDLSVHVPALVAAFGRVADRGLAGDPGCKAKQAIVEGLLRMGIDADDVYLRAAHTVQMEPAFGPPVDTAVALRVAGAMGLARSGNPAAAVHAAELLADKEWDARAGAARALSMCSREGAEPVLRHKLRIGDKETQVVGDCFRALLAVAPDSLPIVVERLRDPDAALAEQAALALGDSRLDAAFEALTTFFADEPARERRRVALVAIALLRRDVAVDWLLERVAGEDAASATAAVEALAMYRHDQRLAQRVQEAARRGANRGVVEVVKKVFEGS